MLILLIVNSYHTAPSSRAFCYCTAPTLPQKFRSAPGYFQKFHFALRSILLVLRFGPLSKVLFRSTLISTGAEQVTALIIIKRNIYAPTVCENLHYYQNRPARPGLWPTNKIFRETNVMLVIYLKITHI